MRKTTALILCLAFLSLGPGLAWTEEPPKSSWGINTFFHVDLDLDETLTGGGVMLDWSYPLYTWPCLELDFRLEGVLGRFAGYARGVEAALVPAVRLGLGNQALRLFVEGGVGPETNTLDIPALGTCYNFLSFAGVGLSYPLDERARLELSSRVRHLSNAGLDELNHGVTSVQLGLGIAWSF